MCCLHSAMKYGCLLPLQNNDTRSVSHCSEQLENMFIQHANTARRCKLSDTPWLVCSMNPIERIATIPIEVEGARTQWVARPARNVRWQRRITSPHVRCRCPPWPLGPSRYNGFTTPPPAIPAHRNSEPDRAAGTIHIIEHPLLLIDEDRTDGFGAGVGHRLAMKPLWDPLFIDQHYIKRAVWYFPDVPIRLRSRGATRKEDGGRRAHQKPSSIE